MCIRDRYIPPYIWVEALSARALNALRCFVPTISCRLYSLKKTEVHSAHWDRSGYQGAPIPGRCQYTSKGDSNRPIAESSGRPQLRFRVPEGGAPGAVIS